MPGLNIPDSDQYVGIFQKIFNSIRDLQRSTTTLRSAPTKIATDYTVLETDDWIVNNKPSTACVLTLLTSTIPNRINLCTNPSFEVGLAGWGNMGGLSFTSAVAKVGNGAALITYDGSTTAGMVSGFIPVTAGLPYTYSFYGQRSADIGKIVFNLLFVAADGVTILTDHSHQYVLPSTSTTGFFRASETLTIPALTFYVQIRIYVTAGEGGGSVPFNTYIDAILFEQSATLGTYFDGSTTPDVNYNYYWTGTPNASTSLVIYNTYIGYSIKVSSWQALGVNSASANVIPQGGGSPTSTILSAVANKWAILVFDGQYWDIVQSN